MPRCFIAINLIGKRSRVKERIIPALKELKELGARTVHPENLHLTLKFLGDVKQDKLQKTISFLSKMDFTQFPVKFRGMDALPSKKYVKVVYIPALSPKLEELSSKIEESLSGVFPKEKFLAHLTLGRIDKKINLYSFFEKYKKHYFGLLEVKSFELMESNLTKEGPRYSIIWSSSDLVSDSMSFAPKRS